MVHVTYANTKNVQNNIEIQKMCSNSPVKCLTKIREQVPVLTSFLSKSRQQSWYKSCKVSFLSKGTTTIVLTFPPKYGGCHLNYKIPISIQPSSTGPKREQNLLNKYIKSFIHSISQSANSGDSGENQSKNEGSILVPICI